MKTTFLKPILALAFVASFSSSCINDDEYDTPQVDCIETTLQKTKEVSEISASSTVTQYLQDDVIEAYVVSSDKGGNFFKTISFQTLPTLAQPQPSAFSVPVDVTSTFISFEPGRKVLIKMKDLYTDLSNGGKRIGGIFVSSSNTPSVGRLSPALYRTALNKSCTIVPEDQLKRTLTIPQLLNDANINTLVELEGVQFSNQAITSTYYNSANDLGGATNHLLTDSEGNSVIFRTSSFANFAAKPVASGRGKVRGILTKFGTDYQFLARTEDDIQLNGPRLVPIFTENFESISSTGNGQNVALPGWSNVSMNGGNEKWEARIFSNNKYAQFSPFGITPAENNVDTRLITPAINLDATTGEFLRFGSKIGFANGEAVTVWISTNYNGAGTVAAVNAATWVQLNATFAPQTASFPTNFTSSGNVDLSSYSGNVYISFRYVGGTNNITSTYQIDNIEVYAQ
ncbi:DUF5017 domain-containing protein [Flavobacterium sp. J49]|uniref:DUF5689 domain-containing protein n=1 Tax=Flavobacterium sp. J49 TaxID=2718534 RepID=UPI001594D468|nr:DUF5689 domain-containing protein [Flavobacterium sp. J49]MBF6641368.1 DUF5017 domain-containing protein [Flavobacterium sp. J49]NIC02615.1 DUF5017 domain-containing protein [Flavobacterium sp. J49]